jgi:hypothetical protein
VLAYFDRPGTSNGPTEALNGRLEHLRGSALGFRNLTNYIARSYSRPAASDPNYTLDWMSQTGQILVLTHGVRHVDTLAHRDITNVSVRQIICARAWRSA